MSELIIKKLIEMGFLISPDLIEDLKQENISFIDTVLKRFKEDKPIVLNRDIYNILKNEQKSEINWKGLEESRVYMEIGANSKSYDFHLNGVQDDVIVPSEQNIEIDREEEEINNAGFDEKLKKYNLSLLQNYKEYEEKKTIQDFISHYKVRYNKLKNMLKNRQELSDALSIHRILNKKLGEKTSLIGMISDISITKNNHYIIEVEDLSGSIKLLIMNSKKELVEKAKNLVVDEVIGIKGNIGDKIVFVDDIFFPGTSLDQKIAYLDEEIYAAFISDLHVGSELFLEKEVERLISWLNGEYGNKEQREISKKVKYLFVVGDLVDGVGVYPGQEDQQSITNIQDQYSTCASYLDKIRKDICIIVCPGNHDAVRLAEPQPIFDKKLARPLYEIKNMIIIPNPSTVIINKTETFEGIHVLMYHGFSFDYYMRNVDKIRNNGGFDRPDLVMKYLLEKRHLAPSHASTQFIPDPNEDYLTIEKLPDIFTTGHLHKSIINQYSKTTTIASSCWQARTPFEERVGHHPEPARLPIVNLKTRETKILKFLKEE